MPPRLNSRYQFCTGVVDDDGKLYLSERVPYRFVQLDDNRVHAAVIGDTLHSLAERFFPGYGEDAADLWWIIADYQPEPIHDPTLRLTPGRTLIIPSERTVRERIFNPARREEHTA